MAMYVVLRRPAAAGVKILAGGNLRSECFHVWQIWRERVGGSITTLHVADLAGKCTGLTRGIWHTMVCAGTVGWDLLAGMEMIDR